MDITKIETNFNKDIIFEKSQIKSATNNTDNANIIINPEIKNQTFLGFGGAITDAAGFSFNQLPQEKQNEFLQEYYSKDGLNYQFVRLPIGSCDFTRESYSYSTKKDLSDFSIEKDKDTIINLAKRALELNPNIHFLASPWSPPKFMKSTKMLTLGGKLKKKYKQTYANYLTKYILAYKENGINIEYITIQNEPNAIQVWESCLYSAKEEADFAINYLYPSFKQNDINTKILVWDHNKDKLYERAKDTMQINCASDVISGFAFHWYTGDYFENVKKTHEEFSNKLLIHTEGCTGFSNYRKEDEIKNAQMYAHDIIGDLNNGTNAFIDWNILLDNRGGPNHKKNYCNSPIMLNQDCSDYIKNLTYTYIKHFSNTIKPNAINILVQNTNSDLEITAFENPDKSIAIVVLSRTQDAIDFNLKINDSIIADSIEGHSIISYLIK